MYQILRILLDTLEFTDELIELESSIIGWCSSESIIRFKGEPKDENEFLEYVRSNLWK